MRKRIRMEVVEYPDKSSAEAAASELHKVQLATKEDGSTVWVTVRAVYR